MKRKKSLKIKWSWSHLIFFWLFLHFKSSFRLLQLFSGKLKTLDFISEWREEMMTTFSFLTPKPNPNPPLTKHANKFKKKKKTYYRNISINNLTIHTHHFGNVLQMHTAQQITAHLHMYYLCCVF